MNLIVDPFMAALGSGSTRNFNALGFEFSTSGNFSWQPLSMSESEEFLRTVDTLPVLSLLYALSASEIFMLSKFEVLSAIFSFSV